jgi:hypothetical protein
LDERAEQLLRKNQGLSRRAMPVYAVFTAVAALLVLAIPRWWSWGILVVTAGTLAGDAINVWAASRRLARGAGASSQERPKDKSGS